ncbi:MAG: PKD domain-containing protein [Planctomycetota bacterium]
MNPIRILSAPLLFASAALAQVVLPNVAAFSPGSSHTDYPWNRPGSTSRSQTCYAASELQAGGVQGPILITALRWRAGQPFSPFQSSWSGCTLPNAIITCSTSPVPYTSMSPVFAQNYGPDAVVVHQGPLAIKANSTVAGQLGPYYVTIALDTPFFYDPQAGDLLVDVQVDGSGLAAGSSYRSDAFVGANAHAHRVYAADMNALTGTLQSDVAPVLQVNFVPAAQLQADFSATSPVGGTPLVVHFQDESFSSNPGGIVSWQWDVDGDGAVDYTTRNPTHTYTECGDFDVSLRVVDAYGNQKTASKSAFVQTGFAAVDFTWEPVGPETLEFTATSTGAPATGWAWDFDDDGLTDATGQVVQHTFPPSQQFNAHSRVTPRITLQAFTACRGPFVAQHYAYLGRQLGTRFDDDAPVGHTMVTFDLEVHHPNGITITGFGQGVQAGISLSQALVAWAPGGQASGEWRSSINLWPTLGSVSTAPWHLIRSAPDVAFGAAPLHLPPGRHGILILATSYVGGQQPLRASVGNEVYGNADLTIHPGFGYMTPTLGTPLSPRVWNGVVYYQTSDSSRIAGFGDVALGCGLNGPSVNADFRDAAPRLGETSQVPANGLPSGGIGLLALSLGYVDVPLDGLGAPGCVAHVPFDVSYTLLADAQGDAEVPLSVPDDAALIGLRIFSQAVALTPGANALGLSFLDTRVGVVGY